MEPTHPADRLWCMSEVDIFADLSDADMDRLVAAAPMREYPAGSLVYTPAAPVETLFILKKGRVRIFRLSPEGRALTTAIVGAGTIFGEMVLIGQQMHDNFAEALDDTVICTMSRTDVRGLLLSDPRVAVRISEALGQRLSQLEQRLSDTVFKSVLERVAGTMSVLATPRGLSRLPTLELTHEKLAALTGATRESTTKALGELAEEGLIQLGRGRIVVLNPAGLAARAGD